jgi:hypothetical protein
MSFIDLGIFDPRRATMMGSSLLCKVSIAKHDRESKANATACFMSNRKKVGL